MKRIPIELILLLLFIGVTIGIAWSKGERMEDQIADQNARLLVLEGDRAKRLELKTRAGVIVDIASKCLRILTLGLIKIH